MMRVAYVCADPGVPVWGSKGCSIHVQEIVRPFLQRGDEVELFGPNIPVGEIAARAGTIPWEVLTGITPRVARVHMRSTGDGSPP